VIHVAEDTRERTLEPIVDPWVEEYEASPRTAASAQGDLYMDRPAERLERPAAERAPQPETRREEPAYDDHDERDHRKSGWSLFGRKRQNQPTYPTSGQRQTEMRATSQVQPSAEPELGEAEDDLEIPSFLRRLAN
jgi:cell division protein FtsZ